MKSIFNGSAIVASALLIGSLMFSAVPSAAETHPSQDPELPTKTQDPKTLNAAVTTEAVAPASDPVATPVFADGLPVANRSAKASSPLTLGSYRWAREFTFIPVITPASTW
jgi:hypothetical protein